MAFKADEYTYSSHSKRNNIFFQLEILQFLGWGDGLRIYYILIEIPSIVKGASNQII
jgi:hypothetical protein